MLQETPANTFLQRALSESPSYPVLPKLLTSRTSTWYALPRDLLSQPQTPDAELTSQCPITQRIKRIKPEVADGPRGVKREPMGEAEFSARYKQRRLDNGKVEIDLTDD